GRAAAVRRGREEIAPDDAVQIGAVPVHRVDLVYQGAGQRIEVVHVARYVVIPQLQQAVQLTVVDLARYVGGAHEDGVEGAVDRVAPEFGNCFARDDGAPADHDVDRSIIRLHIVDVDQLSELTEQHLPLIAQAGGVVAEALSRGDLVVQRGDLAG